MVSYCQLFFSPTVGIIYQGWSHELNCNTVGVFKLGRLANSWHGLDSEGVVINRIHIAWFCLSRDRFFVSIKALWADIFPDAVTVSILRTKKCNIYKLFTSADSANGVQGNVEIRHDTVYTHEFFSAIVVPNFQENDSVHESEYDIPTNWQDCNM